MKKIILKNNILKFVLVCLLLMIVTLTFSACAQVRVMTITNEDNTVDELVSVSIDPQIIHNSGYNVEELKLDISSKSQAQAQTMVDKLNQKIFDDLGVPEAVQAKVYSENLLRFMGLETQQDDSTEVWQLEIE